MNEIKLDKNGLNEEQFLKAYDRTAWDRPAYTADTLLLAEDGEGIAILMVRRGGHPYIGQWAFPGGFVECGESSEEAAARELKEEVGLSAELEQLVTVSTPERDPRGWTVTTCYMGVCGEKVNAHAGDDAADARWFSIDYIASGDVYKVILRSGEITATAELKVVRGEDGKIDLNRTQILMRDGIAFDHSKIILYAVEAL